MAAKTVSVNGKKVGLRKPQIRILAALRKKSPMTRAEIAERAKVDLAWCVTNLGSSDPEIRKANDRKWYPSLITLRLVELTNDEESRGALYRITELGKNVLKD